MLRILSFYLNVGLCGHCLQLALHLTRCRGIYYIHVFVNSRLCEDSYTVMCSSPRNAFQRGVLLGTPGSVFVIALVLCDTQVHVCRVSHWYSERGSSRSARGVFRGECLIVCRCEVSHVLGLRLGSDSGRNWLES